MPTPLSGLDAFFWHLETPTTHLHVASVLVLDPSGAPGGRLVREDLVEHLRERLHRAPPLRRRVQPLPLQVDHPVWVDTPVDVPAHVHATTAPPPGDRDALAQVVARVLGEPLDRSRPLWESWLVDGLMEGRVAVVTKTHHAAIDGIAGAEILAAVLDAAGGDAADADAPGDATHASPRGDAAETGNGAEDRAEGVAEDRAEDRAGPDGPDEPDVPALLRTAGQRLARRPRVALALARRLGGATASLLAGAEAPASEARASALPLTAPPSPFNGAIGPARRAALRRLPLAALSALKRRTGTTVNDVLLAVTAGALRAHLADDGALPPEGLVALVPVAVARDDEAGGNQVSAMLVRLPTHVADPRARLQAAAQAAAAGKAQQAVLGDDTLQHLAELLPAGGFAAAAALYTRTRAADRHRPLWNLVTSNIPGPSQPLTLRGASVEELYALGPVHETTALNLTAMSYAGTLHLGLTADHDLVPDLDGLAARLPAALDELARAHDLPEAASGPDAPEG